jgi:N-acetylmuramoyl-L-alanine amidase
VIPDGRADSIIERPSPNFGERAAGGPIDILLLHYTGMASAGAALERLCDPAAKVSSHYLIDEDGTCYGLVAEEKRAQHAGVSFWAGASDVNSRSIGIELVNPGHELGYRDFPEAQIAALEALARGLLARHAIPRPRVLGHSDVAPLRKQDPGERFPWARLARQGIGLWPEAGFLPLQPRPALARGMTGPAVAELQLALAGFGYGVEGTGLYDAATAAVVTAFQRHFRPRLVDGTADGESQGLLHHLLALATRREP